MPAHQLPGTPSKREEAGKRKQNPTDTSPELQRALTEQCHINQQLGDLTPGAIHQPGCPLQANVCSRLGWEETGDLIISIHKIYSQHGDFWKSSLM